MPEMLTVKGLVLRETAYSETDKIIDILTDTGVKTVRVRGARKPGSKYAAVSQAFSYGEFCMRQSRGRLYLDSAVSLNLFYPLRTNLNALTLAAYFSELVRKVATDQHQPEILRLFLICLHYLSEDSRDIAQVKAVFELRLLTEIGLMPNLVCCPNCMRYEPVRPVLRIAHADLICADCREEEDPLDMPITQAVLLAVRQSVFADLDKVMLFRVKGAALGLFADYAERYLLHRLDIPLPALTFYHEIAS